MASQLLLDRALDANGNIMPGAKATVYADGTSTLISVFSDVDGTIAAANPIVADGNGIWPQRFVNETARVAVTDASGVAIYTMDPAPTAQGAGAAASAISFNPTIDLPFTNVQAAIEGAAAFATSGFAAFGIGITGNTTLLANIDATTLGGGVYRFDGTTTGTFPSGVAAADGGLVETWRQTSGVAMQMLYHATTDRVFHRRMSASVWGAWREALTVNQGAAEGDVIYRGASAWTRLAKGTAGQVLRMNTGATAPEWATPTPVLLGTLTTGGATIELPDLSGWDDVEVVGHLSSTNDVEVQFGIAGPTWRATTYVSDVHDGVSTSGSTTGVRLTRGLGGLVTLRFHLQGLSSGGYSAAHSQSYSGGRTQNGSGRYGSTEAHTLARLTGSGGAVTFSDVNLRVYGVHRA